jgi:hypothetical protein
MKEIKLLLSVAVVVVFISLIAALTTYLFIFDLSNRITAYVTEATTNLTVETLVIVNFTNNAINFSSGKVDSDTSAASLYTVGNGDVTGGNWTAQGGLILENIGNVNVSLNITGTKTAATFIGGANPVYEWNITENEANSCMNQSGNGNGGLNLDIFHNVNTSIADSEKCRVFRFESAFDSIRIDLNLTIPDDSLTGTLTDTLTVSVVSNDPT